MNKTKIEWCDYTWNPITGCHGKCPYCYARRISRRFKRSFEPAFHEDRLTQPLKVKNKRIFVSSMGDFYGKYVPVLWRDPVYEIMARSPDNTYMLLTKQPQNIWDEEVDRIPENVWIGVTVTSRRDQWKIKALENKFDRRDGRRTVLFISYEPMLDWIDIFAENCPDVDWFILGALTGRKAQPCQNIEGMIRYILDWRGVTGRKVFMKNSLRPHWPEKLIQEFPKG